ncbi:hypothetical protein DACRYDRAFT_87535 [Dacryopinax primogenitus]|uniref:Methyltransferase domain-containing protein n=1 Tax=Dacryopinax primogenitus (strain DJM 731) TaxID=1858805 RepID=M5GD68_DACPD|nr:uncharacterized protein DACRYDRAFT_87535 [Dacryopinax primogenitus]EJU04302.1 hypothetical protein DACRYDRAFT_87535 [Dacryopinax primogenitus]
MPTDPKITLELPEPPVPAPPLDRSLWKPTQEELDFLHKAIAKDDAVLKQRVFTVQEKCYQDYPYPCLRAFHFVSLMMQQNAIYPEVLETGKEGHAYLLDLGCMMGTDLRKLIRDGYPPHMLIGCDLRDTYIKAGYELYGDAATCPIKFITGDMFSIVPSAVPLRTAPIDISKVTELNDLKRQLTYIYAGALFHLFDESTQKAIALRLASLWRRVPGGIIFGRHTGAKQEGILADHMGRSRYAHSPQSWEKMWKDVMELLEGEGAGNKIRVKAEIRPGPGGIPRENVLMMYWSVERVQVNDV